MSQQHHEDGIFSRDLTENGTLCLEKGLFKYLEERFTKEDEACTGIKLYADFYTKISLVDNNVNLSGFKRKQDMTEKVFGYLYKQQHPLKKPEAFNFKHQPDLKRLAFF